MAEALTPKQKPEHSLSEEQTDVEHQLKQDEHQAEHQPDALPPHESEYDPEQTPELALDEQQTEIERQSEQHGNTEIPENDFEPSEELIDAAAEAITEGVNHLQEQVATQKETPEWIHQGTTGFDLNKGLEKIALLLVGDNKTVRDGLQQTPTSAGNTNLTPANRIEFRNNQRRKLTAEALKRLQQTQANDPNNPLNILNRLMAGGDTLTAINADTTAANIEAANNEAANIATAQALETQNNETEMNNKAAEEENASRSLTPTLTIGAGAAGVSELLLDETSENSVSTVIDHLEKPFHFTEEHEQQINEEAKNLLSNSHDEEKDMNHFIEKAENHLVKNTLSGQSDSRGMDISNLSKGFEGGGSEEFLSTAAKFALGG